jgi:hypothetical protein
VLVHAANIRYVGATVFISDRAANDGLGAQPREQERQNSGDCTRQEITCYERAGAVDLRKRSFRRLSSQYHEPESTQDHEPESTQDNVRGDTIQHRGQVARTMSG